MNIKKNVHFQPGFNVRHIATCFEFIISQKQVQPPRGTKSAKINSFDIIKPMKIRDIQILFQDKTAMNLTYEQFKNVGIFSS